MIGLAEWVVLAALVFATVTDLRTREVPDWLSYGLVFSGLGIALIKSLVFMQFAFLLYSLVGFSLFVVFAYIMFYAGQWGGGDSKMMMGIGALLGLDVTLRQPFVSPNHVLVAFISNLLVAAFFYGVVYSAALALAHRKSFAKCFKQQMSKVALARRVAFALAVALLILLFFIDDLMVRLTTAAFAAITLMTLYLWIFVKAVENSCMYKLVSPEKLVEGDWLAKDVKIGNRIVCGRKELGVTKEQIIQLLKLKRQKKIKNVLVKEGVPFVPCFLAAFVVTLVFGNLLLFLI